MNKQYRWIIRYCLGKWGDGEVGDGSRHFYESPSRQIPKDGTEWLQPNDSEWLRERLYEY